MLAKLSTITTLYRKFTKNQVLTEGHLNGIVDFFDDQDRISRINLSGVGIVCGFQVAYNETAKTITITQGNGITTDGDLFNLYQTKVNGGKFIDFESNQYTHYKVYDNKKAAYKPFFYNGTEQLEIFELLTAEDLLLDNKNTFPIQNFKTGLEINNAVLLLYLETYEKDSDLCVSLSCDNQGLEIIGNHKVLLVSKEVASKINSHDTIISKINFANLYCKLPDVVSNRIILTPENFISYDEIKKTFTKGIFKNDVLNKLIEGFEILLKTLQMPVLLTSIKKDLTDLYNFDENNAPPDFQYRYDLLNDLIDTYNEIKTLLSNMDGEFCCPDIKAFPKHLMLGEVLKSGPCFEYRHAFYKSPLLTGQNLSTFNDCLPLDTLTESDKEEMFTETIVDEEGNEIKICYGKKTDLQQLYSLIKRSVQLLANYNVNYGTVKITPSFESGITGKKAIPFYNNVGDHLIELWDYEKTAIGKQRSNKSYHDQLLNTKRPLEFITDHNFYRIEGHQGKNYKEALKIIQEIRRSNGLGFNVVVLGITASEAKEIPQNFTSYYLNKNHGYEHKAGVAPGGTFVMIYLEGEYSEYPEYYGHVYPYQYPKENIQTGNKSEKLVMANPVIADFTLPYLCCDDNFISLSLPTNKICFDESTLYYPFHVMPTGGFVKADVDENLNGGVTLNEYGEFVFDPKLVSEELIGKSISFTVNNMETKCEVTIFKKPKFDFTFVTSPPDKNNSFIVDFTITGENQEGLVYTWDFGDGTDSVTTKDTKIQHLYENLPVKKSYDLPVTVTGHNGNCSFEVNHTVYFEIKDIKVSIDKKFVCRNDITPHLITIEPNVENVILSGDGVSKDENENYVFIGNNVPPNVDKVIVMINDNPSNLTITIRETPIAKFTYKIENGQLILSNDSTDADLYQWDIAGEKFETDSNSPIAREISNYKDNSILISLSAINRHCGEDKDGPRKVILQDEPSRKCLKDAREFITTKTESFERIIEQSKAEKFSNETISLIEEIQGHFKQVNEKIPDYISGNSNSQLVEMFNESLYKNLFETVRKTELSKERAVLNIIIESHISLFYSILKCQKPDNIKNYEDQIRQISHRFDELLQNFQLMQYKIDPKGKLKNFLSEITTAFEEVPFIIEAIKSQISKLG